MPAKICRMRGTGRGLGLRGTKWPLPCCMLLLHTAPLRWACEAAPWTAPGTYAAPEPPPFASALTATLHDARNRGVCRPARSRRLAARRPRAQAQPVNARQEAKPMLLSSHNNSQAQGPAAGQAL